MIAGNVPHHYLLEAEIVLSRQPFDYDCGAADQQIHFAGAAVAFGEQTIHFGVRGGVAVSDHRALHPVASRSTRLLERPRLRASYT